MTCFCTAFKDTLDRAKNLGGVPDRQSKQVVLTSLKTKYPSMRPHTTVRYDMAVAGDASTNRKAEVKLTCPP